MIVAQLTGEARHHARWRELTEDEEAVAVAGLRDPAAGGADCHPDERRPGRQVRQNFCPRHDRER
jgi:hypothetical protein